MSTTHTIAALAEALANTRAAYRRTSFSDLPARLAAARKVDAAESRLTNARADADGLVTVVEGAA